MAGALCALSPLIFTITASAGMWLREGRAELQCPILATVTINLKTLRNSREFFPDIIVYHKCQSDRKFVRNVY